MQINIRNAGSFGAVTKCGNVRVRKAVFTALLVLVCLIVCGAFAGFIALVITAGSGGGNETMQYIFIPFAVFGACAVTMPFLFMMRARYTQLVALADRRRPRGQDRGKGRHRDSLPCRGADRSGVRSDEDDGAGAHRRRLGERI